MAAGVGGRRRARAGLEGAGSPPEKRNALIRGDITQLAAVIAEAGARPGISGLVVTGNGAFCAGADLARLPESIDTTGTRRRESIEGPAQALIRSLLDVPVLTIAAVDGPAAGMGFDPKPYVNVTMDTPVPEM